MEFIEQEKPLYTVKEYGESGVYSVCKFKRRHDSFHVNREETKENENKLDNSYSRARSMIKQYGLCNPWDYFCTLTLDSEKYDRYNLDGFRVDLMQFIRDRRKAYKGYSDERLSCLFVPEMHKDGAWHMHGLLYGIPPEKVESFVRGKHPDYLVDGGFYNWPDYGKRFGFVSLAPIKDKLSTVFYITKYISKDILSSVSDKGNHLYFASRPLESARPVADVYRPYKELDDVLVHETPFCLTGMAIGQPWYWPLQFNCDIDYEPLFKPLSDEVCRDFDPKSIDVYEQICFKDVCRNVIDVSAH